VDHQGNGRAGVGSVERERVDHVALGREVYRLRLLRGFDQQELATRADTSRAYVSKLERGKIANPGMILLQRIANALDVPLRILMTAPNASARQEYHLSADFAELEQQVSVLPPDEVKALLKAFQAALEFARDLKRSLDN